MYKIGDVVIYKQTVCKLEERMNKFRDDRDYYRLTSVNEDALTMYVPCDMTEEFLKPVMTKKEAHKLLDRIPSIELIDAEDRELEQAYKDLLKTGDRDDLIRIIKTSYQRNEYKRQHRQQRLEKDRMYFKMAERIIYGELATVFDKTYPEVKQYMVDRFTKGDQDNL